MEWENVKIEAFEQLKTFITNGFSIAKGDFMDFEYTFPEDNRIHWEMNQYECGVIYRVSCWLDALGINHTVEPVIDRCLLNSCENYSGNIFFKAN
ncbi:MAG: hypothetical protein ACFE9M_11050 [Promethearchaeota archaeon]